MEAESEKMCEEVEQVKPAEQTTCGRRRQEWVQQTSGHAEGRQEFSRRGRAGRRQVRVIRGRGEGGWRRPATVVLALFRKGCKIPAAGK